MTWIAMGIGLAAFAALSCAGLLLPTRPTDAVERAFRMAAGAGLATMAAIAGFEGATAGALVGAFAAAAFAVDLGAVRRGVRSAQPSTVTPFQKAT